MSTVSAQAISGDAAHSGPSDAVINWLGGLQPKHFINDQWVEPLSGESLETSDPATERVLARVAAGNAADVDAAVAAARRAFDEGPWPRMAPKERARYLRTFAGLVEEHADELAQLDALDNGMPLATARALVSRAVDYLYHYAGAAELINGETVGSAADSFHFSLREPLGVCVGIIPWNGPALMACQKITPALAAGNTFILKPAEQTPLSAVKLAELALEAGFPAGVFAVVIGTGESVGGALSVHPGVDKIAFTGSPEVGKRIMSASSATLKRLTLELGGKSPNIVFPDADLDAAAATAFNAFIQLSGQICVAGTRLFVQRDAKDEFVQRLLAHAERARLGSQFDPQTTMGPLISREQYDRVHGYIEIGTAEGARPTSAGAGGDGPGYWVKPTIFEGVTNSMRIAREEIFGPVVSVIAFDDEADVLAQANDTTYGLAAAVWTSELKRAHRVARGLRAGTVWINTYGTTLPTMPFGGYKESGLGNDRGPHWYEQYTQEKAVYVQL